MFLSPTPLPILPSPENLAKHSPEKAREIVDEWTKGWENKRKIDEENFEYALERIKLCSFVYHFKYSFRTHNYDPFTREHYSWCPHNEWFNNEEQKFIKSFEQYRN